MAQRLAHVGDILTEMICRCGKVLVKPGYEDTWRCRDCRQTGTRGYRWRIDAEGMTCLPSWDKS